MAWWGDAHGVSANFRSSFRSSPDGAHVKWWGGGAYEASALTRLGAIDPTCRYLRFCGSDSRLCLVQIATFVPIVQAAVLTRDAAGRIASAVENGVTVTYTRDAAGRIATETRVGKVTTYTRDASGRVSGWATV
ncbi:hypothetical protein PA27867_0468 [Cryobacterium arcticum]|uniref:RHS repeat protein n=1 Tax=Cryobacterium arcticum TaxID=670052 RepID=A0A1B1BFS8_9MICO|nr:hypothetical protein PA27867_0468 [Cryobacterium arcticum]